MYREEAELDAIVKEEGDQLSSQEDEEERDQPSSPHSSDDNLDDEVRSSDHHHRCHLSMRKTCQFKTQCKGYLYKSCL